jgi:hypothetical protein
LQVSETDHSNILISGTSIICAAWQRGRIAFLFYLHVASAGVEDESPPDEAGSAQRAAPRQYAPALLEWLAVGF